jgi:nitrogen PTS system EIIA component
MGDRGVPAILGKNKGISVSCASSAVAFDTAVDTWRCQREPLTMEQPRLLLDSAWIRDTSHVATRSRNVIGDLLSADDIILDLDAANKTRAFEAIANFLETRHGLPAEQICASLAEREALGSTGLGRGVAIPHARVEGLHHAVAVLARLALPIAFDAPDAKPVSDMLVLLVPQQPNDEHLKILALVAEMFCNTSFRATLRSLDDPRDIHRLFAAWKPS